MLEQIIDRNIQVDERGLDAQLKFGRKLKKVNYFVIFFT